MGFLDRFRREKPFPEKGTYKEVRYRIDGDVVIVMCSSGKEMSLNPLIDESPDAFDQRRMKAIKDQSADVKLVPWDNTARRTHLVAGKVANAAPGRFHDWDHVAENAATYGISLGEYMDLIVVGREIFAKYVRSQARIRKKSI